MALKQARAHATRRTILESAAGAFARGGLSGTSLNDLIRDSGLTKGAFYFHFSSKEELARAVFRLKQEELLAGMASAVRPEDPALDRLVTMLDVRVQLLDEDPSLRCVLQLGQDLRIGADPASEYAGFQETAIAVIADLIEDGRRDGSMRRDVTPRAEAETVFAAILGIDALSDLLSAGDDLADRNRWLVSLLRRALAPTPAPRSGDQSDPRSRRSNR